MNVSINIRDFEILSEELKVAVGYLRNCRTDVRNADLFEFLDKAISIGSNYSKIVEDFILFERTDSSVNRYQVIIKSNYEMAKNFISEINRVKSIAQA